MFSQGFTGSRRALFQQPVRRFRSYNKEYASGFEHMVRDKLSWLGTTPNLWVILGVGNIIGFGLSQLMYR